MSDEAQKTGASLAKMWEAQWGPSYDTATMLALWELVTSESWVKEDQDNGTPEALATSQDALNRAKKKEAMIRAELEAEHGNREAAAILERHFARIDAWQAEQRQAEPEIALAAYLVNWLGEASGTEPTRSELDALIESLKAYSKPRSIPLASHSEEIRPMKYAAALKARRHRWHTESKEEIERWARIYFRQLVGCAERIEAEQLFRRQVVRTGKLRDKVLPGLKSGSDRSSLLYGLIDPKFKPPA